MSSKFKLTTTTDIEFVVSGSVRDQAKVRDANLYPVIYLSPAVLWFACQMEAKLQLPRVKRRADSFKLMNPSELFSCLEAEIAEAKEAFRTQRIMEAADIANFAMFLAINEAINIGDAE